MPVNENETTLSYSRGPDRPLLDLTIGALLERTASRFLTARLSCPATSRDA